jgi:hypothetical protein
MNPESEALLAEALERVMRGVAYLDAEFPGWEAHAKVDFIDMESGEDCVFAQLVRSMPALADVPLDPTGWRTAYARGVVHLFPAFDGDQRDAWGKLHGFLDGRTQEGGPWVGYHTLGPLWKRIIRERQEAFAVKPGSTLTAPSTTAEEDREFNDAYLERGIFADEPTYGDVAYDDAFDEEDDD